MSESHNPSERESMSAKSSSNAIKTQSSQIPFSTRVNRTGSTIARALEKPIQTGKIKTFHREGGHGYITADSSGEDIFVHISDFEGEYVPLPGDEVEYRLCPIPPKLDKNQAVHVRIIRLIPEVHLRWNS